MDSPQKIYIKDYIRFTFNPDSITPDAVTFDNLEVNTDVTYNDGFSSERLTTENGTGVNLARFTGRSFDFNLNFNQTADTRLKIQKIIEHTQNGYELKFEYLGYASFIPNFPPSVNPTFTPNDVNYFTAEFANAVVSFGEKSKEVNNKGLGVKILGTEFLAISVIETKPIIDLFPCGKVLPEMFVATTDNAPVVGGFEVFNISFELAPSQTYIDSIVFYPQYGEMFLYPAPIIWGTGTQIENTGGNPTLYNETIGGSVFQSGDVLTFMWKYVQITLSSGVICRNATVIGTYEIP